jgi:hypothetical protein
LYDSALDQRSKFPSHLFNYSKEENDAATYHRYVLHQTLLEFRRSQYR